MSSGRPLFVAPLSRVQDSGSANRSACGTSINKRTHALSITTFGHRLPIHPAGINTHRIEQKSHERARCKKWCQSHTTTLSVPKINTHRIEKTCHVRARGEMAVSKSHQNDLSADRAYSFMPNYLSPRRHRSTLSAGGQPPKSTHYCTHALNTYMSNKPLKKAPRRSLFHSFGSHTSLETTRHQQGT